MSNDERPDPLADLFTLFLTPLSGTVRSVEQFRRGVDEFLNGVENFNRSMANLNETTERLNNLLADVEEPIRAAVPQVTRTVRVADEMMQVVSGPAMAVAPGLNRLAETLNTPAFHQLPAQLNQFSEVLGEVSRRLGPLTQVAESAGGILGGLRVPGMSRPQPPADSGGSDTRDADDPSLVVEVRRVARPDDEAEWSRTDKQSSPRRTPSTKTTGKSSGTTSATAKSAGKKSAAAKSAGKKSAAKKSATATSSGKKSPGRKSPAKKSAAPTSTEKQSRASRSTTGPSTSHEKASSGEESATPSASE